MYLGWSTNSTFFELYLAFTLPPTLIVLPEVYFFTSTCLPRLSVLTSGVLDGCIMLSYLLNTVFLVSIAPVSVKLEVGLS